MSLQHITIFLALSIFVMFAVFFAQAEDVFGEGEKKKVRFIGDQKIILHKLPSLGFFYTDPYVPIPYNAYAEFTVGDKKIKMIGGGFIDPVGYRYDKTCKHINGMEHLVNNDGDKLSIGYNGIVCFISPMKKVVSVTFHGTSGKGVFEGYVIDGTMTGTSDTYETHYDLKVNSILIHNEK